MIRPFIKPFHKFSNKTRYSHRLILFTPVSRFFANDVIRRSIITSRKARRFIAIFARKCLKIHTSSWNIDIFRNYHVIKRIISQCAIILQLFGKRATEKKTIDRSIVNYWQVAWQMTSRNVKCLDVNGEHRLSVDSVSEISNNWVIKHFFIRSFNVSVAGLYQENKTFHITVTVCSQSTNVFNVDCEKTVAVMLNKFEFYFLDKCLRPKRWNERIKTV